MFNLIWYVGLNHGSGEYSLVKNPPKVQLKHAKYFLKTISFIEMTECQEVAEFLQVLRNT